MAETTNGTIRPAWRGPLCVCGHDAYAHLDFAEAADCRECACPTFRLAAPAAPRNDGDPMARGADEPPCAECGDPAAAHPWVPEHQDHCCPSSPVMALTFYRAAPAAPEVPRADAVICTNGEWTSACRVPCGWRGTLEDLAATGPDDPDGDALCCPTCGGVTTLATPAPDATEARGDG